MESLINEVPPPLRIIRGVSLASDFRLVKFPCGFIPFERSRIANGNPLEIFPFRVLR